MCRQQEREKRSVTLDDSIRERTSAAALRPSKSLSESAQEVPAVVVAIRRETTTCRFHEKDSGRTIWDDSPHDRSQWRGIRDLNLDSPPKGSIRRAPYLSAVYRISGVEPIHRRSGWQFVPLDALSRVDRLHGVAVRV